MIPNTATHVYAEDGFENDGEEQPDEEPENEIPPTPFPDIPEPPESIIENSDDNSQLNPPEPVEEIIPEPVLEPTPESDDLIPIPEIEFSELMFAEDGETIPDEYIVVFKLSYKAKEN